MEQPHQIGYMAVDQFGETIHLGATEHPRKALLERLSATHAAKMYVDKKDNPQIYRHAGYIINGRWFTLYRVYPFTTFEEAQP